MLCILKIPVGDEASFRFLPLHEVHRFGTSVLLPYLLLILPP